MAEFTEPWASGKSVNGIATHDTARIMSGTRSARSIRVRTPGSIHSRAAPNRIRSHVTSPGLNASSPIAMNRKDDPQIVPTVAKRSQSTAANEPRWVPCAVDRIRPAIV
jgi:hypothetical protein